MTKVKEPKVDGSVEETKAETTPTKERRLVRVLVVRDGQKRIVDFSSTAHENPEYAARVYAAQVKGEVLE